MIPDPFLKICGITRVSDAVHAAEHGATAIGFVFWPRSPRCITADRAAEIAAALPESVEKVGVFVNAPVEEIQSFVTKGGLTRVQLHGDEPPQYAGALGVPLLRSIGVGEEDSCAAWPAETTFLLDAVDPDRRGGTGTAIDWQRAADMACERRVVLAGGLTPDNVAQAIAIVRPCGVDVSSGVEAAPGIKDPAKVARFLENARNAFETRR